MKNKLKSTKAITLVALVITIILLIILAGISINLVFGRNGILEKAELATTKTEEEKAREKLELVLIDLQADKETNTDYTETDFINKRIQENGMVIVDNIVIVDGWQFTIDRSVPKVELSLGKGAEITEIQILPKIEYASDYTKATLKIEITYEGTLASIQLNGDNIDIPEKINETYIIQKEILQNGNYTILVKNVDGEYKIATVNAIEISEDFDIYTPEQLVEFRNRVNKGATYQNKTVQLMNNIDLSSICYRVDGTPSSDVSWTPIGTFKGTFNGNHHTIENLYINRASDYQALFSSNNGTIENVNLGMGTIIGRNYSAGLVGRNFGSVIRCSNLSTSVTASNAAIAGGLVANNSSLVKESCNKASVTVQGSSSELCVGGVVGVNHNKLYSSYNSGTVTGTMTGQNHINVGGVVGYVMDSGAIAEGLYNTGTITAKKTVKDSHTVRVGGVCGTIFPAGASLLYSYNIGSVNANSSSEILLGSVLGTADRGTAKYLYSNGKAVIGLSNNSAVTSNCSTTIPSNINSNYFIKIDNEFPILNWQQESYVENTAL